MLDAQFVDRIGWTLIHSLWQLILLAYVVAICNRLLLRQSANGRYLVGCVGLLAMAVTPIATFTVSSPTNESSRSDDASALTRISAYDTLVGSDPAPQDSTARSQRGSLSQIPADDIPTTSGEGARPEHAGQEHRGAQNESIESIAAVSNVWRDRVEVWLQPALPWIVVIWFFGAMLLSARPLFGLDTVHRLRHIGHSDVEARVPNNLMRSSRTSWRTSAATTISSTCCKRWSRRCCSIIRRRGGCRI